MGGGVMKIAFVVLVVMAALQASTMAVVYKVGDSAGWTLDGKIDYKKWAASKTFQRGDQIVFKYKKEEHNVIQVSYQEFKSCNPPSVPRASYNSGNDSIAITKYGHYFYICSKPGHCEQGQKVDIRVVPTQTPIPTPTSAPAPAPSSEGVSHSQKSNAALRSRSSVGFIGLVVIVGLGWLGV